MLGEDLVNNRTQIGEEIFCQRSIGMVINYKSCSAFVVMV